MHVLTYVMRNDNLWVIKSIYYGVCLSTFKNLEGGFTMVFSALTILIGIIVVVVLIIALILALRE